MNYSNVMKSVAVNRVLAVLAVLALVFSTAPVALAGGSVTNMQVTGFDGKCAIVGENVTVSATVSATIPQGQLSQYGYVIYWGDGQTYDSGTGFFKDSPQGTPFNISHDHAYTSVSSSTKITVAVYHQNPKGQDGNDEAELDITICVAEPDPDTATLTISKVIVGGTAAFDDFSYILNSGSSTSFDVSGTSTVVLELGSYTVVEDGVSGGKITVGSETYSVSYEGCSGSLPLAGATCIVTNTLDVPGVDYGTLQVVKLIVGTTSATFSDFGFDVSGTATTSADFNTNGINDLSLPVGTYTVTEGEAVGFVTTYDNCNNVSVTVGATSTCTITNTASDERFTLTIALSGDGHGHVTSADGFISCSSQPVDGMEVTGDCSETYPVGTVVNLTATPHEGSNFDNSWAAGFGTCTGNTTPCQVTITQNVDLSAHFALNQSSSGGGGGGGSRRSRSSSSDEPVPQVLGEQTSVVPTGAPDAGAGGTSAQSFYMALPSRPRFLAK